MEGFGLVVLVGLIALSGIVLSVSVSAFNQTSRETQLLIDSMKARYLARAGVVQAVWDWYKSNTGSEISRRWSPVNETVTGNLLFKAGMDSSGGYLQSNYAYFTSTSDSSAVPTHVKEVGTAQNLTAGTSVSVTVPAEGVAQGNWLVVYLAMDAARTNPTCTDSQGNFSSTAPLENVSATNTNGDVRLALFAAPVTTALVGGDTITVSWTGNATAKAMTVSEFSGIEAFDVSASAAATSGTAPDSGTVTTNYGNELLIGAIAVEGPAGDSFTPGSGYLTAPPTRVSTTSGTAAANVTINGMYQLVTDAGDYTADATITNRGWAAAVASFKSPDRWVTSGSDRRLTQWQVYNIHTTSAITLDKVKVSWTGGGAALLSGLVLNGVSVWPGGTASSGDTVDVTDTVLASGAHWGGSNTYLQWNSGGPADPVTVTCQFIFSGDSATSNAKSHPAILWDGDQGGGGLPRRRTFDVVSTGQVDQSSGAGFKVLKSVKAAVSSSPGASSFEIVDLDEEDHNIP